jgi:hypothetical protein
MEVADDYENSQSVNFKWDSIFLDVQKQKG